MIPSCWEHRWSYNRGRHYYINIETGTSNWKDQTKLYK